MSEYRDIEVHFPPIETLLELEAEEVAGYLLGYLNVSADRHEERLRARPKAPPSPHKFHAQNLGPDGLIVAWARATGGEAALRVLMEAWAWLVRECLLAPAPQEADRYFITRRGRALRTPEDLSAFRTADLLPRGRLHVKLAAKVWAAFLRGDYDTAVFQAFREVEIAVREAGGFTTDDHGRALVRAAFHYATGPLTDRSLPKGERESMQFLFDGAIGVFKNPGSHREVNYESPVEAAEAIGAASLLLRMVDRLRPQARPE